MDPPAGHHIGMRIGYFLSSEEYTPGEIVRQAKLAEEAGFEALWISDHFHPWNDNQGESGFVWSLIGAVSQVCSLPITTAVTCPTVRIHPAIIAQAAATSALLTQGRFVLGLGSGEALNEHILGDRWPRSAPGWRCSRRRSNSSGSCGRASTPRGTAPTTRWRTPASTACPTTPPPIYLSGFGSLATELAGRIADGYVTTTPDTEMIDALPRQRWQGQADARRVQGVLGTRRRHLHRHRPRALGQLGVPGELSQVLPSPAHFEQASTLVTSEMTRDSIAYGADRQRHLEAFRPFAEAGFDDVYVSQMGGTRAGTSADGFFEFYRPLLDRMRAMG